MVRPWVQTGKATFPYVLPAFLIISFSTDPAPASLMEASWVVWIDWTANYIVRWCKKIAEEGIRSVDVKEKVVDDWNVWNQEFLKRTVWASGCRSWYKNGKIEGRISALYGGSVLHFKAFTERERGEDFNITYISNNMFKFLGNGFTQLEMEGGDLAFYLNH